MSIVTMHANVMALPKLNDWINSAIKTSLSDCEFFPEPISQYNQTAELGFIEVECFSCLLPS